MFKVAYSDFLREWRNVCKLYTRVLGADVPICMAVVCWCVHAHVWSDFCMPGSAQRLMNIFSCDPRHRSGGRYNSPFMTEET